MHRQQLIAQLGLETISDATHQMLTLAPDKSVPALLDVLTDATLAASDSPGGGWVPVHAARLLCDMRAPAALEPLLTLLADVPADADLAIAIEDALPKYGKALLDPVLTAIAAADDTYMTMVSVDVLVSSGLRDERIYAHLVRLLDTAPAAGAELLASYGDARALPLINRALQSAMAAMDVQDETSLENVIATAAATLDLKGTLSAPHRATLERAITAYAEQHPDIMDADAPAPTAPPAL